MSLLTKTPLQVQGFTALCISILLLFGCTNPDVRSPFKKNGCTNCHEVKIDKAHDIECADCHRGEPYANNMHEAHRGLIKFPAHPDTAAETCGKCHQKEVEQASKDIHYTLSNEIGKVWQAFFPDSQVPAIKALPVETFPTDTPTLISDLLRRRCLRCHLFYEGDDYSGTKRGTGCAACHMRFTENGPWDHKFYKKVPDSRCLSCHYGNFVGWDYYGRFETDYEEDYRAPLNKGRHLPRPYGLEFHEMTPDVHKQAGMTCSNCHKKGPCMVGPPASKGLAESGCLECHALPDTPGPNKKKLSSRLGHTSQDFAKAACTSCHAIWSFRDEGRFLLRQDNPDMEDWYYLRTQGSSEIEKAVMGSGPAMMKDKINGEIRPGMWFQGFIRRRWAPVPIGKDAKGRFRVFRPIMNLYVSYLNEQEELLFDNMVPQKKDWPFKPGWMPYTPHTIGPADIFRSMEVGVELFKLHQGLAGYGGAEVKE